MATWKLPADVKSWTASLARMLDARSAKRLEPLLRGVLFARGRRTVTSWLRAAHLTADFQDYYYFIAALGRKAESLAASLLLLLARQLPLGERLVFALDDTPTKRYGRKVQGAGIHHNPTPGPTDQRFVYGHIWVTLAWIGRHPWWNTIALPLLARLYVRRKHLHKIPKRYGWVFRTKLELAAQLTCWLTQWLHFLGKPVWVVVDGFYTKKPFLQPAMNAGAVVVGRLRKDAALWSVPAAKRSGGRGRPRRYGRNKISLAKRAGQKRAWQTLEVEQYGAKRTKTYKTFLATYKPAGGIIRVVVLKETHGWLAFFSSDPDASVQAILEAAADRSAIEQCFHDIKEVEGAGQQQVRNVWANVGAFNLNLWAHTLIELWAWGQAARVIRDRRDAPYDDASRRPSHADRRKALQRSCLQRVFLNLADHDRFSRKIRQLFRGLIKLAA